MPGMAKGYTMGLLRQRFQPSGAALWKQLAEQIGGRFVAGDFLHADRVEAHIGEWTVTLDTSTEAVGLASVTITRLRAPYVNKDGFRFALYQKGAFSELAKRLGMQDILIGDPEFDAAYILKGNDEARLRALFAEASLRQQIRQQPGISLEIKDDEGWFATHFPEGVDELYCQVSGVLTDLDRLKALYDLFGAVLHQLCRIGSAYEDDPRLDLAGN